MEKFACSKRDKKMIVFVNAVIFVFLLFFFIQICPMLPYDGDDWIYLGRMRIPLPLWNGWNPAKVLPEVMMPACGYISANLVYPFTGDFFMAIRITSATILAMFILLLCYNIMHFMRSRLETSVKLSLVYEVFFLLFNFLIFRNRGTSSFMFHADNLCCVFFYTISGIVNAVAVLTLMRYQDLQKAFKKFSSLKKGLFITLMYFAIFSNIFHSEMIAIYSGVILLVELFKMIKNKKMNLFRYFHNNVLLIAILMFWFLAVVFEFSGGRAGTVTSGNGWSFINSFRQMYAMLKAIPIPFAVMVLISICWIFFKNICAYFREKTIIDKKNSLIIVLFINFMLVIVYLVILCAKVGYLSRIEASWNIWFYLILLTIIGIEEFVSSFTIVKPLLLPALLVCVLLIFYPDGRYMSSITNNLDYTTCEKTGIYIMNQIVEADKVGTESVTIVVPEYEEESKKWYFGDNFGELMATTLYNHGIIKHKLEVTVEHDLELLEEIR